MLISRKFSKLITGLLIYSAVMSIVIVYKILVPAGSVKKQRFRQQYRVDSDHIDDVFNDHDEDHMFLREINQMLPMFDLHDHEFSPVNRFNICEIFSVLKSVDPTVESLKSSLFCDMWAHTSDMACRRFFYQNDLLEKGMCKRSTSDRVVPKIVYYVIFGTYVFKFWEYVSVVSARKFIQPTAIYVIADEHPRGYWWKRVLSDVTGVRFIYRQRPKIGNATVKWKHHLSDLVRLQMLLANGGIYLDTDMVVVRSLDPLLHNDITMGLIENGTGMGNALIMARRGSPFVREWYTKYQNYDRNEFYKNSLRVPRDMWIRNPKSIHLESDKFYRPNWFEADLLFKSTNYPWWNNYAIHVWTNGNPVPDGPEVLRKLNTTIVQVFRHVLYEDDPRVKGHL